LKVIFECWEPMNQHEEEVKFSDDATEEEITEEFKEWVWNEIGDNYSWRLKK